MDLRPIDASFFAGFVHTIESINLGIKPEMKWIAIDQLRIDPAYQRDVLEEGGKNIGSIARSFDWTKFGAIIVAALQDDLYAIVDGQHRVLAAALRHILEVPCLIITADHERQAAAFAAINGGVTQISPLAVFNAEVQSGNKEAVLLRDACAAAGVTIMRYQLPSHKLQVGQTVAIGALWSALKLYGPEHLALSLRCITKTRDGNPGMLRSSVIPAICHVLEAEKSWCQPEFRLISTMQEFDFAAEFAQAEIQARQRNMRKAETMTMRIFNFLDEEMGS